jgi:plastocyanin
MASILGRRFRCNVVGRATRLRPAGSNPIMPPAVLKTGGRFRTLLVPAAIAGFVALGGCGGGKADTSNGQQLFTQRCGSCHTLANAGTKGTIGPNLDEAFRQSISDGLRRSTIKGVVRNQIALPQGTQMPANLVTGSNAEDVAAYVAQAIGKKGGGAASGGSQGGTAKANAKNQVQIPADPTGLLKYQFASATAKPGQVTLLSKNDSSVPHDISLKGSGVNQQGPQVSGGKVSQVAVTLNSGQYTFYCSVPGHEAAGMKGTLTVK